MLLALDDGKTLRRAWRARSKRHDETIWRLLDRLLAASKSKLSDVKAVAAARGPGRFTGVRVGLAFATMLSQSLGVPAVGLSLFDVLSEACRDRLRPGEKLLALAPAIRDEVYYQAFPKGKPGWSPLAGLAAAAGEGPFALAGEPAERAALALPGSRVLRTTGPTAAELADFARKLLGTGNDFASRNRSRSPSLAPMYLKPATYQAAA